jgi:hypothetical protein
MPIHYTIQSDLDLLLYVFRGPCTADEYFAMYHRIYQDARRHHGMKILIDITKATLDMDKDSLMMAASLVKENKQGKFPPDHVAILTRGSSYKYLADTLILLAKGVDMHLDVFHNVYDAIRWLDLTDQENDAVLFWMASQQAAD